MIITILIFIVVLGVLVFVHELGHFLVAKKSGMAVEEFGFGFPPRLLGFQKKNGRWRMILGHRKLQEDVIKNQAQQTGNTIYSINLIPLGGFVRILGENNEQEDHPGSFINKPFWPRFFTLIAGVAMNFLLAWVIFSAGLAAGLPAALDSSSQIPSGARFEGGKTGIIEVMKGQSAEKAGLLAGDAINTVDGQSFASIDALRDYITANAGKSFVFQISRGSKEMSLTVESQKNPPEGEGPTGIALAVLGKLRYPWYTAPYYGLKLTVQQVGNIFSGLYSLITARLGLSALGGPVKIAQLTGQVAGLGFVYLMQFTAFLSLNLAVLNILPFPALDGGRLFFLIVEKIRGKRNNQKIEQWANTAGFVFLLLLMLLVTIKDIVKG